LCGRGITNRRSHGDFAFASLANRRGACYFDRMKDGTAQLSPGWVARVTGHEFDFSDWERILRRPFDPWCERIPRDGGVIWALRSRSFDNLQSAGEVRESAIPLIERLNGALSVEASAEPLKFDGVGRIEEEGGFHLTVFAESHSRARASVTATAEVRGANGNPVPPPPPAESSTQRWIKAAEENDDIADMLVFAGRADNWFDIYKALELAEKLAGGEHKLRMRLGNTSNKYKRMKSTANYYRHARYHRPDLLTTLVEARPLLSLIVRTVLGSQDLL
jgi:hypothetical protein